MKNGFFFNTKLYDFWPIYDSIKEFYPIGIKGTYPSLFFEYNGLKKLEEIMALSFSKNSEIYSKWVNFSEQVKNENLGELTDTTLGQAPSFSLEITLEQTGYEGFLKKKKICAALSLIGSYYTVFGIDETTFTDRDGMNSLYNYHTVNIVTASPFKEFKEHFHQCKSSFEEIFGAYRFVPAGIFTMTIDGLQVRYLDKVDDVTVYNALFNNRLEHYNSNYIRGEKSFGYAEWLIGRTSDPIETNISAPK